MVVFACPVEYWLNGETLNERSCVSSCIIWQLRRLIQVNAKENNGGLIIPLDDVMNARVDLYKKELEALTGKEMTRADAIVRILDYTLPRISESTTGVGDTNSPSWSRARKSNLGGNAPSGRALFIWIGYV